MFLKRAAVQIQLSVSQTYLHYLTHVPAGPFRQVIRLLALHRGSSLAQTLRIGPPGPALTATNRLPPNFALLLRSAHPRRPRPRPPTPRSDRAPGSSSVGHRTRPSLWALAPQGLGLAEVGFSGSGGARGPVGRRLKCVRSRPCGCLGVGFRVEGCFFFRSLL